MAKATPSLVLIGPARRVLYHDILAKTEYDAKTKKSVVSTGEKARYNTAYLIAKTENVDHIKEAIRKAAAAVNPNVELANWTKPLKDGNKLIEKALKKNPDKSADRLAHFKDMWVIEAKSVYPPDLSKAVNGKAVEVASEMASKEFYSGCVVKAELNLVAHEIESGENTNRYITAYHNFVVKIGDGDRLGRKSRDEVFKGTLGGTSDKDPTNGDEDF